MRAHAATLSVAAVMAAGTTNLLAAQQTHRAPDVSVLTQISAPYVPGGDSSQSLDFYLPVNRLPVDRAKPYATVVFIHGGGLTGGDRRDPPTAQICHNFVQAGIGCASVNYRLVSQAKWPAQPQDVAAAVSWIMHNVTAQGGDPARIVLFGHSSGCHLAALVATDPKYLAAYGLSPRDLAGVVAMGCLLRQVPPAISDTAKLRAFFDSGRWIYPSLEAFRDADPTLHVAAHTPATLVLVAEAEQTQPPILENAQRFAARMRELGRPVDVEVLPDRLHMSALTMMQDPLDPTFMRVVDFTSRAHR
jgi:arylformamidase